MKFGKEFTAQMVQEWQQAYMDYNLLKSILKDIMIFKQSKTTATSTTQQRQQHHGGPPSTMNTLKRKVSLYRAFSGLTTRYRNSPRKRDEEAILVSAVQPGGPAEHYQTMFMMSSDEGGEHEIVFFRRLDDEFNKVLHFYRKKVEEVVEEADELTRQMNVLIALRIKVINPANVAHSMPPPTANAPRKQGVRHMDVIHEVEMKSEERARAAGHIHGNRPARLDILDHVKVNVEPETPISTLKTVLAISSGELNFTKDQLKKSEELMVQAFVEFHHKLRLLKSYSFLNQLAFSKIMKKYDKITMRNASKSYLDMVDRSYLGSCDEVNKIMERVEAAFVKHFSNGNRGKAMTTLRPKQKRERHRVTFLLGLFVGCSIALIVTICIIIQSRNIIRGEQEARTKYMDNIFPLYCLFGFIVLHMIMLSGNIFFWRKYRVNYPFIFNLKEGTDLSYRQLFLLSSGVSVLSLAAVTANLDLRMDPKTNNFSTIPELVPVMLVGLLLLILFSPFNIIYRRTRFFLITSVFHCILAPFYKVTLPDSFMADQITSQVQALRSMQFYVCYYIWGNFRLRDSAKCQESEVFKILLIVVGIIPYWFRFLQCLRRLIDEKRAMNLFNGLKYLSIIIALTARTIHEQRPGDFLQIVALATSIVATIYATYWDIVVDWGLLQRKSKNGWLRDKLIISNKAVYFLAIVLNILLRLAWMQTVLRFTETSFIHKKAMIAMVACLEIIRRGIWNFFRLENEHLNNVGKYRAFNSVPLPFNYDDEKHS